ncbi:efflux RND transporter periplasmic adaptor subunit [Winslowiella iniecta]|nr:efflux RND transporter periplasmic adaptor subunit [Winslowiella iniecta]
MPIFKRIAALCLGCMLLVNPARSAPLPAVQVITTQLKPTATAWVYMGRVEAIQTVEVLTRVEGFIARRHFTEGQMVESGQLLFEIEPAQHHAAVEQAKARVQSAQAVARNAQLHLSRLQRLTASNAISKSDVDAAEAERDIARASLAQMQAELKTQQLNLGYTRITAPIAGRIGHTRFNTGSLVNPASGSLVTVTQLDPIRVRIAVNEHDYISAMQQPETAKSFHSQLTLANGYPYPQSGEFESVDNHIDPQTGSVAVRLRFANPQHLLLPGGVVNVALQAGQSQNAITIPVAALSQDKEGFFVLLVDHDNRVAQRRVTPGRQREQHYLVTAGLKPGEQVIVSGIQQVRPGMVVNATAASE